MCHYNVILTIPCLCFVTVPFFSVPVLNCVRLLTRFVPYIFEDPDWRGFFWSTVPGQDVSIANNYLLANTSVTALAGAFHHDFFMII